MRAGDELASEYREALSDFLAGAGEQALQRGYELGRRAMSAGLGLLEIAALQERALAGVLSALAGLTASNDTDPNLPHLRAEIAVERAFVFFAEVLSPFEMGLRGYREANATLKSLNYTLAGKNLELGEARDQAVRKAAESVAVAASERSARLLLQETHERLKDAQSQLVASEKLASLGQLVAGVAHEINNPLSFVVNNTAVMQRDAGLLRDVLRLYQEADPALAAADPAVFERIRELSERIDLAFTLESLEDLLSRSRDGLRRIQQIVLDLRSFAHLDEAALQDVDLNASVQSTLNIIGFRAREQQVTLEVDLSPLPLVTCYPDKINQVVLNLILNAIDACPPRARVTLRTRAAQEGVEIHVVDTGSGIAPAHRDKIFDPFFTTKPPGKGTGLGLSISHGIVAAHGGRIDVESAEGRGTHFTVYLPRRPAPI